MTFDVPIYLGNDDHNRESEFHHPPRLLTLLQSLPPASLPPPPATGNQWPASCYCQFVFSRISSIPCIMSVKSYSVYMLIWLLLLGIITSGRHAVGIVQDAVCACAYSNCSVKVVTNIITVTVHSWHILRKYQTQPWNTDPKARKQETEAKFPFWWHHRLQGGQNWFSHLFAPQTLFLQHSDTQKWGSVGKELN